MIIASTLVAVTHIYGRVTNNKNISDVLCTKLFKLVLALSENYGIWYLWFYRAINFIEKLNWIFLNPLRVSHWTKFKKRKYCLNWLNVQYKLALVTLIERSTSYYNSIFFGMSIIFKQIIVKVKTGRVMFVQKAIKT